MPSSFVDQQAQFVATASALQEDLAGVGSSDADLHAYFERHQAEFDQACWTAAVYSSEAAASDAAAQVAFGTPFSQVAARASQGGPQQCVSLPILASELPASADLGSLATGAVSSPIDDNGSYVLVQITSRTPTDYSAVKQLVSDVVQQRGATVTQKAVTAAERHATVQVDPRYGVWVPVTASVFPPLTPPASDVPNASANEAGLTSASSTSFSG
jgi:hypothetical protein